MPYIGGQIEYLPIRLSQALDCAFIWPPMNTGERRWRGLGDWRMRTVAGNSLTRPPDVGQDATPTYASHARRGEASMTWQVGDNFEPSGAFIGIGNNTNLFLSITANPGAKIEMKVSGGSVNSRIHATRYRSPGRRVSRVCHKRSSLLFIRTQKDVDYHRAGATHLGLATAWQDRPRRWCPQGRC
jgi:hypothetical protein